MIVLQQGITCTVMIVTSRKRVTPNIPVRSFQIETVQGTTYEGIFKTFSHEFDVVLELAHRVDAKDPQKLHADEVVENLIFQLKDIVFMCAPNVDPDYAYSASKLNIHGAKL